MSRGHYRRCGAHDERAIRVGAAAGCPRHHVYVSGTILARGRPFEVLEAWRRDAYVLVTSPAIVDEVERVLRYPRIRERYGITDEEIGRLTASLRADAAVVPGELAIDRTCSDADDDKVLICALEAQADFIVTGDPDLLELGRFGETAIVTPAEFLMRLSGVSWETAERGL